MQCRKKETKGEPGPESHGHGAHELAGVVRVKDEVELHRLATSLVTYKCHDANNWHILYIYIIQSEYRHPNSKRTRLLSLTVIGSFSVVGTEEMSVVQIVALVLLFLFRYSDWMHRVLTDN